ncbi:unnamed protein product [Notodromas monacha]|uniref:Suppressor of forked domain-containing protein n=1 Tax=Notodromas monacha TaxID=399045 RepID=A0A7R9GAF6_9CRUS|nr:unnamed protein product [Notodromas monacha]CAG0914044.1 unnamed protein product [Notodromas monacha]
MMLSDRVRQFLRDIEENQYAVDAWGLVVRELQGRRIEEVRPVYENAISVFPTAGRFWKLYIEHEIRSRNHDLAEMLFQRCLMKVLNLDLWRAYLAYVRDTKHDLPSYNEKMAQAYDFALDKIGFDVNAFSIWNDYISFLEKVEAVGRTSEVQKIHAIRKVYHRGIVIPMLQIDKFWERYVDYERLVNLPDSLTLLQDKVHGYLQARNVSAELESVMRGLNKGALSIPPTGTPAEIAQVELWKRYISWEKTNPLKFDEKTDYLSFRRRVVYAYEQALLCLSHHPDVWIDAADYLEESAKKMRALGDEAVSEVYTEEVIAFYNRGVKGPMRRQPLLHFCLSDFYERRGEIAKAASIYEEFVGLPDVDPTLAFIHYMAFMRRTDSVKSARQIFRKARENPRSRFHVFVAAALMEYLVSKDKNVAFKIFELGLKKYSSVAEYVLAYVDYLSHLNEDNNIRVLFERVLSTCNIHPEKLLEIWDRYLEFETNHGDLASILKVEKRRSCIVARVCRNFEAKESLLTIDRYKFGDLMPVSRVQLLALGYNELSRESKDDKKQGMDTKRNERVSSLDEPEDGDDEAQRFGPNVSAGKWRLLPPCPFGSRYALPDVRQMTPFQPKLRWFPGKLCVPGGEFPLPTIAADVMKTLPPPKCFRGPFVHLESLMDFMVSLKIPGQGKTFVKEEKDDFGTNKVVINGVLVRDGDGSLTRRPEIMDIYSKRQKIRSLRGGGRVMAQIVL